MRAKVLTLRFSPQLGRFDDAPLIALQHKVVLDHVREHLAQVGDETMLVCIATWRERTAAEAAETDHDRRDSADDRVAATPDAEPHRGPATPVGVMRAEFSAEQQVLFDQLRTWRRQKAHDEGAPPYVILTNRQLADLVRQRPRSNGALANIQGIGDKKIARHGQELLATLWPGAPREADASDGAVAAAEASA